MTYVLEEEKNVWNVVYSPFDYPATDEAWRERKGRHWEHLLNVVLARHGDPGFEEGQLLLGIPESIPIFVVGHCHSGSRSTSNDLGQRLKYSQLAKRMIEDGLELEQDRDIVLWLCKSAAPKGRNPSFLDQFYEYLCTKGYCGRVVGYYETLTAPANGRLMTKGDIDADEVRRTKGPGGWVRDRRTSGRYDNYAEA